MIQFFTFGLIQIKDFLAINCKFLLLSTFSSLSNGDTIISLVCQLAARGTVQLEKNNTKYINLVQLSINIGKTELNLQPLAKMLSNCKINLTLASNFHLNRKNQIIMKKKNVFILQHEVALMFISPNLFMNSWPSNGALLTGQDAMRRSLQHGKNKNKLGPRFTQFYLHGVIN